MQVSKEAELPIPCIYGGVPTNEDAREYFLDPMKVKNNKLIESHHISSTLDLLESFMCKDETDQRKTCWPLLEIISIAVSAIDEVLSNIELVQKLRPNVRPKKSIYEKLFTA